MDSTSLQFKCPARIYLAGPTGSGKSSLIVAMIKHREMLFDKEFNTIIFCSPEKNVSQDHQTFMSRLREVCNNIVFMSGLPNFDELSFIEGHKLVICDDLISEIVDSKEMFKAVTVYSNKQNLSLCLTTQNLYLGGKFAASLVRNASYLICFQSLMDSHWLAHLSRQMFPSKKNILTDVMQWVQEHFTTNWSKYILIDCSPKSTLPDKYRIRTQIIPNDNNVFEPIIFVPK